MTSNQKPSLCPVCDQPVAVEGTCMRCRARWPKRRRSRFGLWSMILGGALLLVAMVLWAKRIGPVAEPTHDPSLPVPKTPDPDSGPIPGALVALPFRTEKCVPWHVSAASAPPSREAFFLSLSSKASDPYGYVMGGFSTECQLLKPPALVEDLHPGELQRLVEEKRPAAIVATGLAAVLLAQREAANIPLLYALVPNPGSLELDRSDAVGVVSWVPMEPATRHILKVLPPKQSLAFIAPSGPMKLLAEQAMALAKTQGRKTQLFELEASSDLAGILEQAASAADAWVVFPDHATMKDETFTKIMTASERKDLPVAVPDEDHVQAGALVGAGSDTFRIGAQLCRLAGAMARNELPQGSRVFCPEYSFAVINQLALERLHYLLEPAAIQQAKLYTWH